MADPLGLIAGDGRFPIEIARAARRRGRRVVAVAFRELSSPALTAEVDELSWLHLGQVGTLLETLRAAGASEAVRAGKVPKLHLYGDPARHRPDALALELVASLRDRRDASILGALAALLEQRGIRLLPQAELVPDRDDEFDFKDVSSVSVKFTIDDAGQVTAQFNLPNGVFESKRN